MFLRPPFSRINFSWDISVVLDFLSFYYSLDGMPLDILTYKCVMLLALSSMQRVQTLHVIDISYAPYLHNSVFISIEKLLKQSSSKIYRFSIDLTCYKDDPSICPYITL